MSAATAIIDRAARVQRSPRALAGLGVLLVAILLGSVVMVLLTFRGEFTDYVPVQATIVGNGNGVAPGYLVVYRDVPIGSVASSGRVVGSNEVSVSLHIDPYRAVRIPANVTATIDPITVFGTEAVILEVPAHPAVAHLTAGETIAPSTSTPGANVQGAVTSLDQILNALHPAQLEEALTAIATALQGQGKGLGSTLASLDTYLHTMLPHLPVLEDDLRLLAPVADQVAASAPALVGSLSNLSVTSQTLTAHANDLKGLLGGGASVAGQLNGVIAPDQLALEKVIAAAGPFLQDVSQSPTELARVLSGLQSWATSWAAAESSGPYLSFSTSVTLANATDLVFAALNDPGSAGATGLSARALGTGNVDPAPYTSRTTPLASSDVRIGPAVASPAEAARAGRLDAAVAGHRVPSAAVAALYLDPLLNHLVVGS